MFKESEKGLKKTHHCLGVPRVRSRVMMNHANEAQTRNQEKLIRTPEPIVINDDMDAKRNEDLTRASM
jgi:hypothetical protein